MRNKKEKDFRKMARALTVGKSIYETKKVHRQLKKVYKLEKGEI